MGIYFLGDQILFRADKISFCEDYCTCDEDPEPEEPPDTDSSCCSTPECPLLGTCTPSVIQVTFAGTTLYNGCVECNDGTAVSSLLANIDGSYVLRKTTGNSCVWEYVHDSDELAVIGWANGIDCSGTGDPEDSFGKLIVRLTRLETTVTLEAVIRVDSPDYYADFIVFSGSYDLSAGHNFPETFTVNEIDATPNNRCTGWQTGTGGGKIGYGGTATAILCRDPKVCNCDNTADCLTVTGVSIPADLDDFDYADCHDSTALVPDTCTATTVYPENSNTCEWFTEDPVEVGGVTNLRLKIKYYPADDTHAVQGCGYYLYLYAYDGVEDIEKGIYYSASTSPAGTYTLIDDIADGLPGSLTVTSTCPAEHDCDAFADWPSAVTVEVWDGTYPPGHDLSFQGSFTAVKSDVTGEYNYVFSVGVRNISVKCYGTYWEVDIHNTDFGCHGYYRAPTHGGGPYLGPYEYSSFSGGEFCPASQYGEFTVKVS